MRGNFAAQVKGRKTMKTKILMLASVVLVASGCSSFGVHRMFDNNENGFVMLAGDAEGIRSYNDGLNGLVTNTKTDGSIKSSYWQNREKETSVRALRFQVNKRGAK